jgi:hypothetical protein
MKRPNLITKAVTLALIIALIRPLAAHTDDFYPAVVKDTSEWTSFFKLTGYQLAKSSLADIAEGLGSPKAAILEPDLSYGNKAIQQ